MTGVPVMFRHEGIEQILFWLGENRPRATFDALFNIIRPIKWP